MSLVVVLGVIELRDVIFPLCHDIFYRPMMLSMYEILCSACYPNARDHEASKVVRGSNLVRSSDS